MEVSDMKWLVTIQQDDAKTIAFEVEAQGLSWTESAAVFATAGRVTPAFVIESPRLVTVENVGNAA